MIKSWVHNNKLLCSILVGGFVLRIIPILWGVPISNYIRSYHPDEPKVYMTCFNFPWIYFTTRQFPVYGTVIQYTVGFILIPFKLILIKFLGLKDIYLIMTILACRLASVAMGTATIFLTFLLARKIFNHKVGIISALFLAFSFYHTLNSSVVTMDVAMGFFIILNFLTCFYAHERKTLASYCILGITTGLLMGTKITGGMFIFIPFLLSFIEALFPQKNLTSTEKSLHLHFKLFAVYIVSAGIVFALYHPHLFIKPEPFISYYLQEKVAWVDRARGSFSELLYNWRNATVISLGYPIAIMGFIGFFLPGKENLRYKTMLLILIIMYFGFWQWYTPPRFIIPLSPYFCIFAAHLCFTLIKRKNYLIKMCGISCIMFNVVFSLYFCINGIYLRLYDTRSLAARYIEGNIPIGKTIGVSAVSEKYSWKRHAWRYPRIDFQRKYKEVNFLENPDFLVLSSYDYNRILKTLHSDKISFDYKLDQKYYKEWYRFSPPSPEIFKFYDDLLINKNSEYSLMKKFQINVNVPVEFPPPEILIYKLEKLEKQT